MRRRETLQRLQAPSRASPRREESREALSSKVESPADQHFKDALYCLDRALRDSGELLLSCWRPVRGGWCW